MAIQNRRGLQTDFDPLKMVSGEIAIATDDERMYYCTTDGNVQTVATIDDLTGGLPSLWTNLQTFNAGVVIKSNLMANNSASATAKYLKVARVIMISSYNRVNFQLEYFGTGTTPRRGVLDGYVYTTTNYSTFSTQTYLRANVNAKFPFIASDVKIVKSASATAGKSIWDIYVLVSDYGKAYVNCSYAFTETGELQINPDNGSLITTLPIVSDTFVYESNTYTVSAVDNITIVADATQDDITAINNNITSINNSITTLTTNSINKGTYSGNLNDIPYITPNIMTIYRSASSNTNNPVAYFGIVETMYIDSNLYAIQRYTTLEASPRLFVREKGNGTWMSWVEK